MKAFLPAMLERDAGGHIVCLASLAGFVGAPGLVDYSASKFAAVGFMEALANELVVLGKQHIKTTIICPTFIRNKMIENLESATSCNCLNLFSVSNYDDFLSPEYVAEETIQAVLTNMKMLILPKKMNGLYFLKGSVKEMTKNLT